MALGGGTFTTQNKILPGAYINFVSLSKASAALSERGVAALPLSLEWGPEGEVFTVEAGQFEKESLRIFGYPYTDEHLKGLRDLFLNTRTCHFYRLNAGGVKAQNDFAAAKYPGARGNDLRIVIEMNEKSTDAAPLYDVTTYLDTVKVDAQEGVAAASALLANDYVTFKADATLAATAGTPLTGGVTGTVEDAAYQTFLDAIEAYSFNTLGCLSTNETIKALFAAFTKRMRDTIGAKFQTVLHRYEKADYEGVISVENNPVGVDADDAAAVYWVTGAEAGCGVNATLLNRKYDGEFDIDVRYTQTQLEDALRSGKLIFHRVGSEVHVLDDVNTFVSVTDAKSADFSSNQVMRVLDQIALDIASMFNQKYNGKMPNDAAGRIALWNDIVKHHQELQTLRALQNFTPEDIEVLPGDTKKAVVVNDRVEPVAAMAQLYMTVKIA